MNVARWLLVIPVVALALTEGAAAADAYIYVAGGPGAVAPIGRVNLDGTGRDPTFIPQVQGGGIAVDDAHMYWVAGGAIGRANLDGTGVDNGFIPEAGSAGNAVAV